MINEVIASIDSTLTSSLAATLCGLSLSTAAFLTNLVKSRADESASLQAEIDHYNNEKDPVKIKLQQGLADHAAGKLKDAEKLLKDSTAALHRIIWAFSFFAAALVESVTLDPIAEASLMAVVGARGHDIAGLQIVDVALSGGALGSGLGFLALGAAAIKSSIPKVQGQ